MSKINPKPQEKPPLEIVNRIPIPGKRSQEYAQWTDGSITRLCYAPHNPHYFLDKNGNPHPINLDAEETKSSSAGRACKIKSSNVCSVGRTLDEAKGKYLGIRPDVCQEENTESLEFDLVSLKINGQDQDLKPSEIKIVTTRQRCRQLIPATKKADSFEAVFRLHLKEIKVKEDKRRGEFIFNSKRNDDFRFRFRRPVLTDGDGLVLGQPTEETEAVPYWDFMTHTLEAQPDGSYIYTKKSLPGFEALPKPDQYFIDADTYYSETSDGQITLNRSGFSWSDTRNHDGTYALADDNDTAYSTAMLSGYYLGKYYINRAFIQMDTSGATNPGSATVEVRGYSNADSTIYIQEGTQGASLEAADFNNFTGSAYASTSWNTWWKTFTLNATGVSNINTGGVTYYCLREEHDYGNSAPTPDPTWYRNGIYFSESTSDPYLSITEAATAPTVTTSACSNIGTVSAQGNGSITATGGENATERGFCYIQATSGDPTTADSKASDSGSFGTGSFNKTISGLSPGTAYRVRAFATNSAGTAYGTTVDLTTASANLGGMFFSKLF